MNDLLVESEISRVHFKFTRFYCLTLALSEGEEVRW